MHAAFGQLSGLFYLNRHLFSVSELCEAQIIGSLSVERNVKFLRRCEGEQC